MYDLVNAQENSNPAIIIKREKYSDQDSKPDISFLSNKLNAAYSSISNQNDNKYFEYVITRALGWGCLSGHNQFGTIGLCEFYKINNDSTLINGIDILVNNYLDSIYNCFPSKFDVCIWNDNGINHTPGTEIYNETVETSNVFLKVGGKCSYSFDFSNNVKIKGNFYIGLKLNYDDSCFYNIATNAEGCANSSKEQSTALYQKKDGEWNYFSSIGAYETSLALFPHICDIPNNKGPISDCKNQINLVSNSNLKIH